MMKNGVVLLVNSRLLGDPLLSDKIADMGYVVKTAENRYRALRLLQATPFDMTLLCLSVPEDDRALLFQIQTDVCLREMPVLVISHSADTASAVQWIKRGAVDCLPQPVDLLLLEARLRAAVRQKRRYEQRQRAVRTLQESERRYRDLFEHAHDLIQGMGPDGRFKYVNRRWCDVLGYRVDEAMTLSFKDILPADQHPRYQRMIKQLQQGQVVPLLETTFITKTGQELIVEGNLTAHMDQGELVIIRGIFRDITSRKQAEAAVEAAIKRIEALYQVTRSLTAYENLPHLLQIVTNSVADVLPADRVLLQTFDMARQEVKHFVRGGPGADKLAFYSFETALEGLTGWALCTLQPALSLKGVVDNRVSEAVRQKRYELNMGAIIVVPFHSHVLEGTLTAINKMDQPDFTHQDVELMIAMGNQAAAALENVQLYESERQYALELQKHNEELDTFSHMVAHNLKNPLASVISFADVLTDLTADTDVHHYAQRIAQASYKMVTITNELLLLAKVRKSEVMALPLSMANIVEESIKRLQTMIDHYQPEIILPEVWPVARGHAAWVEEIWVNYLSNAMKYGRVPVQIELGASEQQNGFIRFWIRDNGPGLSPDAQVLVFTPFERLDQVKIGGHGLGLSIVRRIAEKLGGQVGVVSQVDEGSVFWFELPAAP